MYKVLLVDDEILIREAIGENIRWGELGYQLIGSCENGKEAVDMIRNEKPDLILTDIFMPYMDGIALTKFVYENYPEIKVVIISGYDEFEYAKQALKYQVLEYMLKPVTATELTDFLLHTKEIIDKERNQEDHILKIKQAYEDNLPVMKERFLNQLLNGSYKKSDSEERLQRLGIALKGRWFTVVLIEITNSIRFFQQYPEAKEDLVPFAVSNIANELVEGSEQAIAFINGTDTDMLILAADTEQELNESVEQQCTKIREAVAFYIKVEISMVVGQVVQSVEDLNISYDNAKSAAEYKFLLDGDPLIYGKDFTEIEKTKIQLAPWIEELVLYIKTVQKEELEEKIAQLFNEFRNAYLEKKTVILYIQNMVLSIVIAVDDADSDIRKAVEEERNILNYMTEYKRLSEIEDIFLNFCLELMGELSGKRDNYWQKQAVLALDYIEKNYMNSDISLNSVCSYLSMSTSYFSSIFKNYTGETFIEALTKKRVEKAKKLLESTALKNYQIADSVGYSDPHYFSIIFKKATGQTPTEYARNMR